MAAAGVLVVVLVTSTISGVFGMAGGLILMGALALLLPVSAAFFTHGLVQLVSNGWRSWRSTAAMSAGPWSAGSPWGAPWRPPPWRRSR